MKPDQKHFVVYANVSEVERGIVAGEAAKEGISLSDFVRGCINSYLLEQGDDVILLAEKRSRDAAA